MINKILLDTDIGDDIDDAFALALLTQCAKENLVGVTTVFRNTYDRAQQVEQLLKTANLSIPVYAGERLPYKEPIRFFDQDSDELPQNQHPCQWNESYSDYTVNQGAVDFIINCAEKYGKQLVIMPIGPLTNIARAIEKAPESMRKIGKIVLMGGWFTNYEPEWNILCDPEAANIVFSSGLEVYAVGLDVTLQCTLDSELLNDFRNSEKPYNKQIVEWLDKWFAFFNFEKSVMHDPLAIVSHFEKVCTFEKRFVKVNLTDKRGAIECYEEKVGDTNPIFVATEVDKEKFYNFVKKTLLN